MKHTALSLTTAALIAVTAHTNSASATLLAYDNFGGDDLNLTSLTGEASYTSAGDGFNEYASGASAPFALIDSTTGTFPADTLGIVVEDPGGNYDAFFGAVDTVNGDNNAGNETAVWTFDFATSTDIVVTFDAAAMGDFESSDLVTVTVRVDGGVVATFAGTVDEAGSKNYTLASGLVVPLDDPLSLGGTELGNTFQTISTGNVGAGSQVTVTLETTLNGGSEAFALDSIAINGNVVPEPTSLALMGLGGLLIARRRKD